MNWSRAYTASASVGAHLRRNKVKLLPAQLAMINTLADLYNRIPDYDCCQVSDFAWSHLVTQEAYDEMVKRDGNA